MGITKEDLVDADILDAEELASTGVLAIVTGIPLTSTTSGTKRVVVNSPSYDIRRDVERLEAGNRVVLVGTTGADGAYTIAVVVDEQTFDVVEAIPSSTGGTFSAYHPVGAAKVGVDASAISNVTSNNVQGALQELGSAIDAVSSGDFDSIVTDDNTRDVLVDDNLGHVLVNL